MPETTVAAIIFRNINTSDEILITKRNHEPFKDYFCLPGGHIDKNETAETAVVREVKEETGLEFTGPEFLCYNEEIYPEKGIHNIVLAYVGEGKGKLIINEEVSETRWVDIDEVADMELAFGQEIIVQAYVEES